MKRYPFPVLAFFICLCQRASGNNNRIGRPQVSAFELRITYCSHTPGLFTGLNLYVRTNSDLEIYQYVGSPGQPRRLVFHKKIARQSLATREFSHLNLDSLKDKYDNPCLLFAPGEEYGVTFNSNGLQKMISLHHYYLDRIQHIIELVNGDLPDTLKLRYLPKDTRQDCSSDEGSTAHGMSDPARTNPYAVTLSKAKFDMLVDSCTTLLETKKVSEISDSGHIYIILCANTIFYTRTPESRYFDKRFAGGRYGRFDDILNQSSYIRKLGERYRYESTGSGICYPKLDVFSGGLVLWHSLICVEAPFTDRLQPGQQPVNPVTIEMAKHDVSTESDLEIRVQVKSIWREAVAVPSHFTWRARSQLMDDFMNIELEKREDGQYVEMESDDHLDNLPPEIDSLQPQDSVYEDIGLNSLYRWKKGDYRVRVLCQWSVYNPRMENVYSQWVYFRCLMDIERHWPPQ